MKAIYDSTGGTDAIAQGVSTLVEGSAVLMKALDEVEKLHPFVGVAVMAFKAVWTLEMTRRENDKKIMALHLEIRDMIEVLAQLEDIKDPQTITSDNKGRMQKLCEDMAKDIKDCANACDTYSKKKIIVKVLNGPIWEGRLAKYGGLFVKHRSDFEFALSIHTAVGVDAANMTLEDVKATTMAIDEKVDMMMKMFQSLTSPEEKKLTRLVNQKGGSKAVQENDKLLRELSKNELQGFSSVAVVGRKAGGKPYSFEDLQDDLRSDPDEAIRKNFDVFSRKLKMQQDRILEETKVMMQREGDRVIEAVTGGPHDKIVNRDMHILWKEMGWRGSVKSRYFIMALRDFYHEKWGSDIKVAKGDNVSNPPNRISPDDEWALAYVNVQRLQPISESFDDDASGFITVAEVNTFTTSRPQGWSLPRWLAFWAIGWHQSLAYYAAKIREILAKMFAILPHILPANRGPVHKYLGEVYQDITTVEASVNPCFINETLQARFKDHLDGEEARLKKNLDTVRYDIDAMDTLILITGAGRIGKFAHTLLYLLLQHHFEIMRICKGHVIHPDELWDAAGSIDFVMKAFRERYELLKSIFKQQRLEPKQQFANFAHGIFQYINDPTGLWAPEIVKAVEFPEYPYDDTLEEQNIKPEDILNYPMDQQELDLDAYGPPVEADDTLPITVAAPFDAILGPWNGFLYRKVFPSLPSRGMISMTWRPSRVEDQVLHFKAFSRSNLGDFTITGQCSPSDTPGFIKLNLKREFVERHPTQYWDGELDIEKQTIMGTWGNDLDRTTHHGTFLLKRTAPEDLRFRPAPVILEDKDWKARSRALWTFAISAIRAQIHRQSWPWSYFKERRDNRNQFLKLYIRNSHFGCPLDGEELMDFRRVRQSLTAADSRYYHSLANFKIRRITNHGVRCANCHGSIGGARIICVICQARNTWSTLDLCEAPHCVVATVEREDLRRLHVPTHDVIKVRRVVHIRQFGKLEREAKEALERARLILNAGGTPDLEEVYDSDYPSQVLKPSPNLISSLRSEPVCTFCQDIIKPPCWYYIHGDDDTFICDECESNREADINASWEDTRDCDLVRCQLLEPDEESIIPTQDRLANLEERFNIMDNRLQRLDSKVDTQLNRVEDLLHSVLDHLKDDGSH
ncbi:hypothetical protein K439DRAFT_1332394 [Ramaria rubella]|nr:hypothetical protein K439DRAFT_1332394 [Ramaria rubella]